MVLSSNAKVEEMGKHEPNQNDGTISLPQGREVETREGEEREEGFWEEGGI